MASQDVPALPSNPSLSQSKLHRLGVLVGLTLFAGAVGASVGYYLVLSIKAKLVDTMSTIEKENSPSKLGANVNAWPLPPIIANLADPPNSWIRLETVMLFDSKIVPKPEVLSMQLTTDVLGYLKTLSVAQLAGPSGFQNLRDDLNERAHIRSNGAIQELVIQALVIQ